MPSVFPQENLPSPQAVERDLELARQSHPILQSLAFQREQLEIDVRLAKNDTLPSIDLEVEGSQDFGNSRAGIDERGKLSDDPRSSTEVKAAVRFELPVQRREARGRLGAARIRLAQLERRERFAREQVEADARLALEALQAAYDQTGQARENFRLAERLQKAEERKLELGLSNLINVNIREVQTATAARQLVGAQEAYFRALAEYQARIARTPDAPPGAFPASP
jgi:outer membrane protein TolC